jgi:hypothetical protein
MEKELSEEIQEMNLLKTQFLHMLFQTGDNRLRTAYMEYSEQKKKCETIQEEQDGKPRTDRIGYRTT